VGQQPAPSDGNLEADTHLRSAFYVSFSTGADFKASEWRWLNPAAAWTRDSDNVMS